MDRSPSQRSNSARAPGANRLTPNSPKLSLDSSPRIPYDTHAFAGQGDYSELRSPLMNEHKVPLELLQQAYLSTSMEQRYSQMSTSSASPHQSPAIGGSPFAAPPNVASFPSARQFSNSGSGFNTPTPFSNGFTFGAPPRQPIGDQDNRSVPDILVSPQTERIRQGELSGRRGSDDLGLAKPVEIEVQPQPQAGYEAAVESAASAAPQLSMSHQGYPRVSYTSANLFPPVTILPASKRKRILVTGGAGFVGSHLVDRLMFLGHEVTVLDNFFSGAKTAVSHWVGHPHFELVRHDVTIPFHIECDMIYHLACPASPRAYQYNQIKTMKTNFLGTMNMLGLAKRTKARFLLSSTSEVYGSPEVHPQPETYWGNVNPIGPRACYDEGKRVAEALTFGYLRQDGVDVRVARIFNSFGPRMTPGDGRVVSNFVLQALKGEDITIYGDGSQTRSLLFVHDLVDGLILLMNSDCTTPVNIGSPYEGTILHWAKLVIAVVDEVLIELTGGDPAVLAHRKSSQLVFGPMPQDDPPRRQADTTRAKEVLGWHPQWSVRDGLRETVKSFLQSETIDIDVQSALRGKIDL